MGRLVADEPDKPGLAAPQPYLAARVTRSVTRRFLATASGFESARDRTTDMKSDRLRGRPEDELTLSKDADRWTLTTLFDLNEVAAAPKKGVEPHAMPFTQGHRRS